MNNQPRFPTDKKHWHNCKKILSASVTKSVMFMATKADLSDNDERIEVLKDALEGRNIYLGSME